MREMAGLFCMLVHIPAMRGLLVSKYLSSVCLYMCFINVCTLAR